MSAAAAPMTAPEIAYIDCLPALERAREVVPAARLVTDNPLLAADPRVAGAVENIDSLMRQCDAVALGGRIVGIAKEIDRRLAAMDTRERYGLTGGNLQLAGTTTRLLGSYFYRSAVMARALKTRKIAKLHLFVAEQPRFDPWQPFLLPYLANPYRTLAEAGFFGSRTVAVEPVPLSMPDRINDTMIRSLANRMALLPLPVILLEVAERLGIHVPGVGGQVFILGENDSIRETLPWLALRGIKPVRIGKLHANRVGSLDMSIWNSAAGFNEAIAPTTELQETLAPWLETRAAETGEFDRVQSRAIAVSVVQHLAAGLMRLGEQVAAARGTLSRAFSKVPPDKRIVLTNGLLGASGSQNYAICKELGATVIDFEHGVTTGLSTQSQAKIAFSEATTCDVLLAFSERSRRTFVDGAGAKPPEAFAIGVPEQQRRLLRGPLQRWLARRYLGNLPRGKPVLMHVSTFLYGTNMRPGSDAPTESQIFTIDSKLVMDVYSGLDSTVIFKQYPTQRFPHEPGYGELLPAAGNLRFVKDEDFRYIRAAADAIVTATPTSTLGWCLGTGVPIVYLASRHMNTLVDDEIDAAFRKSLVVVDLDDPEWPARLRALLSNSLRELRAEWACRKEPREKLVEQAILGPTGSPGRKAAEIVADIRRRRMDSPTIAPGLPQKHVERPAEN